MVCAKMVFIIRIECSDKIFLLRLVCLNLSSPEIMNRRLIQQTEEFREGSNLRPIYYAI
jgi:hypothetical protein